MMHNTCPLYSSEHVPKELKAAAMKATIVNLEGIHQVLICCKSEICEGQSRTLVFPNITINSGTLLNNVPNKR